MKGELSTVDTKSHTTRDILEYFTEINKRKAVFIDTAGLDKSLKQSSELVDEMVYYNTLKRIRTAQIHIICVESLWAFKEQDYGLIRDSIKEGRGIIIFINKWDLVDASWYEKAKRFVFKDLEQNVDVKKLPVIFGSALKNKEFSGLYRTILTVYDNWNARVTTGMLNDWLAKIKKIADKDYENVLIRRILLKIRYDMLRTVTELIISKY